MARARGRQVSVDIVGDAAKLERELKRAERDLQQTRRQLEEMGVTTDQVNRKGDEQSGMLEKLGKNWKQVALAVTAAVAVLVGAGATLNSLVRSAADFEAGMVQSLAIMGDVSAEMRTEMERNAREVAKATTFSAREVADSYFYLASAGLDAEQQIAALPQVAKFAQAGMFDMARATDLATDAQSALGLASDDAQQNLANLTRVTDVFVGANTLANATVEQFSEAITNKAGAALRVVNKDIEEGVAVLALYADRGVKGAAAGEGLSIMLRDVSRAAVANAEAFAWLGIEVFDQEGNLRNLADVIESLDGAFDGMSDAQLAATLDGLGLTRSVADQVRILSGGGDQIRAYENELRSMGGVTDEVANKQLQSFNAQMQLLNGLIDDMKIEIGNALLPVLTDLVHVTQDWINTHGEQFAEDLANAIKGAIEQAKALYDTLRSIYELGVIQVSIKIVLEGLDQLQAMHSFLWSLPDNVLAGAGWTRDRLSEAGAMLRAASQGGQAFLNTAQRLATQPGSRATPSGATEGNPWLEANLRGAGGPAGFFTGDDFKKADDEVRRATRTLEGFGKAAGGAARETDDAAKKVADLARAMADARSMAESGIASMGRALTSALAREQEVLLDQALAAIDRQRDAYLDLHNDRMRDLNAQRDAQLAAIDAEVAALQQQGVAQRRSDVEAELALAWRPEDRKRLLDTLADMDRQARIAELRDDRTQIDERTRLQAQAMQDELRQHMDALQRQQDDARDTYRAMTEAWQLESRARELLMAGELDTMEALIADHLPGWLGHFQSFGESVIDGPIKSIGAAMAGALQAVGGGAGAGLGVNPAAAQIAELNARGAMLAGGGAPAAVLNALRAQVTKLDATPAFGAGGFAPSPMLAVVGDRPGGEHIFGTDQLRAVVREEVGRGGGQPIVIHNYTVLDGRVIDERIERYEDWQQTTGSRITGGR